jgi:hypothetical protein
MIRKILGIGAIAVTTFMPAGAAQASTHYSPSTRSASPNILSGVYLCAAVDDLYCIAGEGVGNQLELEPVGDGASTWSVINGDEWIDNSGNCIYLRGPDKNNRAVLVSGCDPTQTYEEWNTASVNPFNFKNVGTSMWLGYFNPPTQNKLIFGMTKGQNHDIGWHECNGSGCVTMPRHGGHATLQG